MPGGLIQLTAYGAQDFYLTGNPQISFFKAVYRRYTNFSMEMIEILPNVNVDLQENADSSKLSFKISRNGDLVKDMYLVFTLPSIFSSATKSFEWIKRIGEYIIKEVTITVGGKELDKQHGEYMHFYNELYLDESQKDGYNRMIGNFPQFNDLISHYTNYPVSNVNVPSISERQIIVPLQFWFNKSFAQALPLIAMQYDSEPEITFTLRQFNQLYTVKEGLTFSINGVTGLNNTLTIENVGNATNIVSGMLVSGDKIDSNTTVSNVAPTVGLESHIDITLDKSLVNNSNPSEGFTATFTSTTGLARNRPISADSNLGRFLSHNSSTDVTSLNINPRLEVNYIFLDKDERKRFASVEHEYLVKQVQFRTDIVTPTSDKKVHTMEIIKDIQHPVSTLIWGIRRSDHEDVNLWSNYTNWPIENTDPLQAELVDSGSIDSTPFNNSDYATSGTNGGTNYASLKHKNIMLDATLKLNGSDRFNTKSFEFFNYTNNYQHHKRIPTDGINVYTFSVGNNDNMQPSGTCNMSKFEATLQMTLAPRAYEDVSGTTSPTYNYNIYFYAVNYNVFRVIGGMANMEFSN